jgi:hypothetical protein
MRNLIEEFRSTLRDETQGVGPVGNLLGSVDSVQVERLTNKAQHWRVAVISAQTMPSLYEAIDLYTYQRPSVLSIDAGDTGIVKFPDAEVLLPAYEAVVFHTTVRVPATRSVPIRITGVGHQLNVYLNNTLVASGSDTINLSPHVGTGDSILIVLGYGGKGSIEVEVSPDVECVSAEAVPAAPSWRGSPTVYQLDPAKGLLMNRLSWSNDAFASAWQVYRSYTVPIGGLTNVVNVGDGTFTARINAVGLGVSTNMMLYTAKFPLGLVKDVTESTTYTDFVFVLAQDSSVVLTDWSGSQALKPSGYTSVAHITHSGANTIVWDDKAVTPNEIYLYKITSFGLFGISESDYSTEMWVYTNDRTPPASITGLDIKVDGDTITATFNTPADPDYAGVRVYGPYPDEPAPDDVFDSVLRVSVDYGEPNTVDQFSFRALEGAGLYYFVTFDSTGNEQLTGVSAAYLYAGAATDPSFMSPSLNVTPANPTTGAQSISWVSSATTVQITGINCTPSYSVGSSSSASGTLSVNRPATGGEQAMVKFQAVRSGVTVADIITIPPMDSDTVSPDLLVVPGVATNTSAEYTASATNPRTAAAVSVTVTRNGLTCQIRASGGAVTSAGAATFTLLATDTLIVTRPNFGAAAGTIEFKATIAGGGTEIIQRTIQPVQQDTVTPGIGLSFNSSTNVLTATVVPSSATVAATVNGSTVSLGGSAGTYTYTFTRSETTDQKFIITASGSGLLTTSAGFMLDRDDVADAAVELTDRQATNVITLYADDDAKWARVFRSPDGTAWTAMDSTGNVASTAAGGSGNRDVSSTKLVTTLHGSRTVDSVFYYRVDVSKSETSGYRTVWQGQGLGPPPDTNSVAPNLTVTATPGTSNYSIAYSGDSVTLSIDGGTYAAPSASPISVARGAAGTAGIVYAFKAVKDGITASNSVTIPPLDADTVTPDLSVTQTASSNTTVTFTATATNPKTAAAVTPTVRFIGCAGTVNGTALADGAAAVNVTGSVVATRPVFGAGSATVIFTASVAGGGSEVIQRTVQPVQQDTNSVAPNLSVTATPGVSNYSIIYSGDSVTLSIDGGTFAAPSASPLTVARGAAGTAGIVYTFKAVKDGITATNSVTIPPIDADTVTPDLVVTQTASSNTTVTFTSSATNPKTAAAVTPTVKFIGCAGTVNGVALADGATAVNVSGNVGATRPAFGAGSATVIFTAVIAGGGSEVIQRTIQPVQQDTNSVAPNLTVTATPGTSSYSIAYSGDTVTLSIDGGAYATPGASPLSVSRGAIGTAGIVYTFKAVKDGITATNAVTIPPLDADTVTPDLTVTQTVSTNTVVVFTASASNPRTAAAITPTVKFIGCSGTVNGVALADGDPAVNVVGNVLVTRPAFGAGSGTAVFAALVAGGGSEVIQRTVQAVQQDTNISPPNIKIDVLAPGVWDTLYEQHLTITATNPNGGSVDLYYSVGGASEVSSGTGTPSKAQSLTVARVNTWIKDNVVTVRAVANGMTTTTTYIVDWDNEPEISSANIYPRYDGDINAGWRVVGTADDDARSVEVTLSDNVQLRNFILNGDAEAGTTGWVQRNGNTMTVDTTNKYAGAGSFQLNNASAVDTQWSQDFSVLDGDIIEFSGYVKTSALPAADAGRGAALVMTAVAGVTAFTALAKSDAGITTVNAWDAGLPADGTARTWTYIWSRVRVTGEGIVRLALTLGYGGTQSGTAWFDQVRVTKPLVNTATNKTFTFDFEQSPGQRGLITLTPYSTTDKAGSYRTGPVYRQIVLRNPVTTGTIREINNAEVEIFLASNPTSSSTTVGVTDTMWRVYNQGTTPPAFTNYWNDNHRVLRDPTVTRLVEFYTKVTQSQFVIAESPMKIVLDPDTIPNITGLTLSALTNRLAISATPDDDCSGWRIWSRLGQWPTSTGGTASIPTTDLLDDYQRFSGPPTTPSTSHSASAGTWYVIARGNDWAGVSGPIAYATAVVSAAAAPEISNAALVKVDTGTATDYHEIKWSNNSVIEADVASRYQVTIKDSNGATLVSGRSPKIEYGGTDSAAGGGSYRDTVNFGTQSTGTQKTYSYTIELWDTQGTPTLKQTARLSITDYYILGTAPAITPTSLAATEHSPLGHGDVDLSWTNPAGASGTWYTDVYYKAGPGSSFSLSDSVPVSPVGGTQTYLDSQYPGASVSYYVSYRNAYGPGGQSNQADLVLRAASTGGKEIIP